MFTNTSLTSSLELFQPFRIFYLKVAIKSTFNKCLPPDCLKKVLQNINTKQKVSKHSESNNPSSKILKLALKTEGKNNNLRLKINWNKF